MAKKIVIACQGAALVELDELTELQGNLKILPETQYQKLKSSIVDLGFSFPVHAWRHGGKKYILDATQRTRTLKRMREEDKYVVPKLPVVWVSAKDKKEAVRKLLAAASQYGQVTPDGLHELASHFKIELEILKTDFSFPEINMPQFEAAYYTPVEEVSFKAKTGSKEIDEADFQSFHHQCPKCGFSFDDKKS